MDFPRLEEAVNKCSWYFNQSKNVDEYNGWRKLCAIDCNGNIQNIGNPNKTCGCFLNYANRNSEGKKGNKGENKKSKESSIQPSSDFIQNVPSKIHLNKLNSVFDRTSTFVSKEKITPNDKNNKLLNSELSYFSDKNPYDLGLSKFVENVSEDSNPKKFTLFPEKSNSSPSILDGLNSYFKKNTPPRSRCLSDPQSKQPTPTQKSKECSPVSVTGFNCKSAPSDFVTSRISSLRSKIDELELEYKIKDETINENSKLPSFFIDKHCHGANEQPNLQQDKTVGESFTPLYSLIPKRLFDSYPVQDNQSVITPAENKYIYRRKENDSGHQKAINPPSLVDFGKSKQNLAIPCNNTPDFYPFHSNAYHSLNYPPMHRQAAFCGVDTSGLSHDWLNFLKKFQSFSTMNEENMYRTDGVAPEVQNQGKKNYRKNGQNQNSAMECKFCKSNMESPKMYKSHNLKQRIGRRTLVTCPVLRKLVCERCGETGDNAHTLSYCPRVIAESGKKPVSVAAQLKKTKRVASGRVRKSF